MFQSQVKAIQRQKMRMKAENENESIDERDRDVNENNDMEANTGQQRGQDNNRGAHGARRGACSRACGAPARADPQQQAALKAQRVADDVPPFTGSSGIKAVLPKNPSTSDYVSLFLTGEFLIFLWSKKYVCYTVQGEQCKLANK